MNRRIFNRKLCGVVAIVCTALSSCIYEGADEGGNPQALYVTFRLAMSGATEGGGASKATAPEDAAVSKASVPNDDSNGSWGDAYGPSDANGFENKILKDQFHVTFYDSQDGNYAGRLENILCTGYAQAGQEYICEFRAELKTDLSVDELRTKNMKMMVVANVPNVTDGTLQTAIPTSSVDAGLGSLTYSYVEQPGSGFPAIPMWGVYSLNLSDIAPGVAKDLGTVDLLRALAKVEVCVDRTNKTLDDVKVKSVTVSRVNTSGYGLPGKWNEIAKTTDLKFAETLRVPAGVVTAESRVFNADAGGTVVFYLPECVNGTAGNNEIKMTVAYTVDDSDERTGEILFCPYSGGSPLQDSERWDIVRNHHYKYEITSVGVIRFKASVHEWDEVETEEVVM